MADNTKIEWADATLNYVNGCSVHSPGCTNCYAMRLAGTRLKHHPTRAGLTQDSKAGPVWTGEVRAHEPALQQALSWKRPRRIFWNAHGDLFHENAPDEWIDRLFAVCALTPQHTHLILTKRSKRMREYFAVDRIAPIAAAGAWLKEDGDGAWSAIVNSSWPLPGVWLGVSVEDQARADERVPDLLATPAAIRWISAEPLLGPVDLRRWMPGSYECGLTCGLRLPTYPKVERCTECGWQSDETAAPFVSEGCPTCGGELEPVCPDCNHYMVTGHPDTPHLDWVIVGGESGPGARPMRLSWVQSLRDQCQAAGVAFLMKQWGEWAPAGQSITAGGTIYEFGYDEEERCRYHRVGKKRAGRMLDGVLHDGYPA